MPPFGGHRANLALQGAADLALALADVGQDGDVYAATRRYEAVMQLRAQVAVGAGQRVWHIAGQAAEAAPAP